MAELARSARWNGVALHEFVPGVNIHAVGGEQVLVCRVNYDPGFGVPTHSHEHTEQVMVVTEGELELTVAGQGRGRSASATGP